MNNSKKIPIGGIKFSDELAHFTLACRQNEQMVICEFLQHISSRQINIPFLCGSQVGQDAVTCFCVSAIDGPVISEIVEDSSIQKQKISMQLQVGSLTIFPHKNDVSFVMAVMNLMERLGEPVHSFSTSISALIVNTRVQQLPNIAHQLMDIFQLPENHSPFLPEFQLRQPHTLMKR